MKRLEVADAPWLARIHGACFPHPWSEQSFKELLEKEAVLGWGTEGIGFGLFQKAADEIEVLTLAVIPNYRRQGAAKNIMAKALSQGAKKMFLDVAASNTAATELYQALGFETISTRKAYYNGVEDAYVMQKTLD